MGKRSYKDKVVQYCKILFFVFLLSIPISLIALPENFFDTGKSICISVVLFDKECYGCGMTRAIMHIIHFDFQRALDFNRLGFVVFPLLVMLWLKLIFGTFGIKLFKWF
ncbi:MAG TPA: DUF2752 domain-containing protein [Flavobacteriales bacterium]|nr:DUF2752 domain-containing protein [Flavobacteriales bacterium]HIN40381.1 DUF2752 domain-containing protein [Flavobacteriales bacterium]